MTTCTQPTLPPSIFPARFQVLSGSALKLLACILMLIDHTGVLILANYKPALRVLFTIGSTEITWYRIVRDIGRSAFPIFCFLLMEGFLHTQPPEIRTEPASLCIDLRNPMEFHVQQYLALPGYTECIFYLISGLSWTLCAGSSVGEATAAVVMYCRTLRFLFCFTRRLQLAWLSSDPDHVSAPYPEVPAGTCQHSLDEL